MKKKRTSSEKRTDRISNLPESIRSHIVSFLPTKDAVKTSILSRNWRNVCFSLTNFDFNQSSFQTKEDFKNAVDHLLMNRDGSDIQRFGLRFSIDDELITDLHVNTWISFAVRHNVRELDLYAEGVALKKLPSCFFTCPTLTSSSLFRVDLKLPRVILFPMLKTLELVVVRFHDDDLTENLFSSCPVLENLTLKFCITQYLSKFTISAPYLKFLMIEKIQNFSKSCEINIFTPNLKEIKYIDVKPPNISSETLSSLLSANFEVNEQTDLLHEGLNKILMGLCNVSTLSLRGFFIEIISWDSDLLARLPTKCGSLKHLKVDVSPTKHHVNVLISLLRSYPNLQTLNICFQAHSTPTTTDNMTGDQQLQGSSAMDTLKRLKKVEIENFEASKEVLHFLRYLLENANILEKMNIKYTYSLRENSKIRMEVSEKLLTLTKVSCRATIVFS